METIRREKSIDSKEYHDRRSEGNYGFLSPRRAVIFDFVLLNISFFVCNIFKRGSLTLPESYSTLLLLFYFCWFITNIIGNKFKIESYTTFGNGILCFFKSSVGLLYFIVFLVVVLDFAQYSRIQIFGTVLMLFTMECILWGGYNQTFFSRKTDKINFKNIFDTLKFQEKISYPLVMYDLVLVLASFYIVNYIKRGSLALLPNYYKLFLIFIGLWFFISLGANKYLIKGFKSVHFFTWQWMKAGVIMLATMSLIVFGLRLFYFSRFQALGSIALLILLELILISFYYRITQSKESDKDIESADQVKDFLRQENIPLDVNVDIIRQKLMEPARRKFEKQVGGNNPELFAFMDKHIDLDDMVRMETAIERSCELFDVSSDRLPVRVLLNLWKVNDIRWLNQFFLKVHQILMPGGYYLAHAHTISTHYRWIYRKFPKYFAHLVYFLDFCFNRVMPKLSGIQKIYFSITKGKGRAISRAEFLGRLSFCGFSIVAEKEIDRKLYVIARKVKTSSLDQSPTYGPLVTLKRSGFEGKAIDIYKFRTMHPYSEYLQQYVYKLQGLKAGGKLDDDFRVTTWGRFMRKYWLDELPMFYNWFKGDLNLVGVRPLSFQYLSLYDAELQDLRKKVKPGLIPPFYADLPKTFEEICESERKYVHAFLKHPIRTQCSYFVRAFINIAIKGARSN